MQEQDPLQYIIKTLENKSCVKQKAFRNLLQLFHGLEDAASRLVKEIIKKSEGVDDDIQIAVLPISDHEFHVRVAGDLLVFIMHTNIITFDKEHAVAKTPYVAANANRKYFGQIMVYNFMADSIKYNRENDPGYLVSRILVNYENHFFLEGEGKLGFLYKDVSEKPLQPMDLDVLVKLAVTVAIEHDLVSPPYPKVKYLTLGQKNNKTQLMGSGTKIGFTMSYQQKTSSQGNSSFITGEANRTE